jgi:endonuclease-8
MPEGHTIHRIARDHGRLLAGRQLQVTSPQGRFAADAARVDGARLERLEAYGKHLFYWWSTGEVGHVHLGLFGKYRVHRTPEPPVPQGALRMRLRTIDDGDPVTVDLRGPTACAVGTPEDREQIVARLGPDPLRRDGDPDAAIERMRRSRAAIGGLLLDQSVVAGIGNVYRAELLFVHGIHPARPGRECNRVELTSVWERAVAMLRAGVRANRIVTVDPSELDLPKGRRVPRREATYVYRRDTCLRCGTPIATIEIANRTCYYCPTCQSA